VKRASVAVVLTALTLLGSTAAQGCRIRPRPEALRGIEADAIVLVLVTRLEIQGASWRATAVSRGVLAGRVRQRLFGFDNGSPGDVVVTCNQPWRPRLDRYQVLYLQRSAGELRVVQSYPYWWARASGDPRLARLHLFLPLGAAREPSAQEARLLDLAEARIELPRGVTALNRYTRVYARVSAGMVTGMLVRSRTPRRLIVDSGEDLPTEQSCGCALIPVRVDLDDLRVAGRLPPFNP
jgi:hypothetical protein